MFDWTLSSFDRRLINEFLYRAEVAWVHIVQFLKSFITNKLWIIDGVFRWVFSLFANTQAHGQLLAASLLNTYDHIYHAAYYCLVLNGFIKHLGAFIIQVKYYLNSAFL